MASDADRSGPRGDPAPVEPVRPSRGGRARALAPKLAHLLVAALSRTWRLEIVAGRDVLERVLAGGEPVVFCLWHNRLVAGAGLLLHHMAPSGIDLTVVVSASRDGDIAAGFAARYGARVVRGSSTRAGARALRGVIRAVRLHGSSPIVVPDGPKGPVYRFKPGTLAIAGATGLPILCVGMAACRASVLRSWDRLIVPWPFTRIAVAVAEPRPVPAGLSREEAELECRALEAELGGLGRRAEAAVGASDPFDSGDVTGGR